MSENVKVFYKGETVDLIVFGTSEEAIKQFKSSPTNNNYLEALGLDKVFVNNSGRGKEGNLGEASHSQLETEFGVGKKIDDFIKIILTEGEISDAKDLNGKKYSSTNDSKSQF